MFRNQKGFVLVATLAIIAVLIAAALQLAKQTGKAAITTLAEKNDVQIEQIALSGINLALLILTEDAQNTSIDSIQETWADTKKLAMAIAELGIDNQVLSINITDELSKIQINALLKQFPGHEENPDQRRIWQNMIHLGFSNPQTGEDLNPEPIINCIKDWLDSGDNDAVTGISGAESDFYLTHSPPYACANRPLAHILELSNIKGIGQAVFIDESNDMENDPGQPVPFNELFSVYGIEDTRTPENGFQYPGKININTAGIHILAAVLPEGMDFLAEELIEYRQQKDTSGELFVNPLDKGWYKKVIDLSEEEMDQFDRSIRYSSHFFKIESRVKKDDTHVTLNAFVKREKQSVTGKWNCRIIQIQRQ